MDTVSTAKLSIRQRSSYARETWKRSFISTVRPTVRNNLSQKQSFLKMLFKPEEFENSGFSFSWARTENIWKRSFWKRWRHDNHVIFLTEVSSNEKSKMAGDRCALKFLRPGVDGNIWCVSELNLPFLNSFSVAWTENIWCVFRVLPAVFKFLRRILDEALVVENWSLFFPREQKHAIGQDLHLKMKI